MTRFEALTPEQVRKFEKEAIKQFTHDKSEHPHVEPKASSPVLARFKSVFPFDLFPDELIVEEKRIIWIKRFGPGMCEVITLAPADINRIEASAGPLFGHVHIAIPRHDIEIIVERLRRKEAFKARDLIEGLMDAAREGIKIEGVTPEEKVKFLIKLAHVEINHR